MKSVKLTLGAALLSGVASTAMAADKEVHFIMCGGEVRAADQAVVDQFEADYEGVKVNLEAVPWGTCQDKSLTLAAAGDPPSIAYMGSRTLRQLAKNDLIVPAEIDPSTPYQPGVLNTVTVEGTAWGYPHAFSTKALYLNCDIIEASGQACEAPATWDAMYDLAKGVVDNTDAAGVGLAGKDFDNTMHQFLNYLYSNGGAVIDSASGKNMLDSKETRETLEFYGKLVDVAQDGPTAWERDQLRDLFNDGQIAMYVSGPWGHNQHNEGINQKVVPVPAGPSGTSGSILITDSIVVFKGSGHEDLAQELAKRITSGDSQYDLDSSWGLTPILDYSKLGKEDLYYADGIWPTFTASIATGGPEPLVEDFKSLQSVFTNMVQGIILKDDTVDNLVTIAAEELDDAL
ncbi:sugar ABC transporter substrate-binding protein [Shimia sp. R10_1]|uniref:ABC transporter substrate-binding protein n=1 Tax=Shimia sp. R10_1 TaxID=2821095 RepID=UPI001AD9FDD3|nr:sugar ABC transporter substrate-binding protein [Shimia sp. R10_1]MBO9473225.1 sugar ABC transporter substrate-binding protein [Shimia sp. R10_1]